MADLDASGWSGEGDFTQVLIDHLRQLEAVRLVRVEDAPATRSDADYNFISNEIFVGFATDIVGERVKRFGLFPGVRQTLVKRLDVGGLERVLAAAPAIGEPDYADASMLQYLRTERVVPPYQTRGYKIVELVRIYEAVEAPAA
jgi:hypothetical protein